MDEPGVPAANPAAKRQRTPRVNWISISNVPEIEDSRARALGGGLITAEPCDSNSSAAPPSRPSDGDHTAEP